MAEYTRFRADGWPYCPRCDEDELYSLADPATAETICGCYRCGPWPTVDRVSLPHPEGDLSAARLREARSMTGGRMEGRRLLDLFCGAGGAAMGYHRAGFEVVGVDIEPQPNYPFEFHQADALRILNALAFGFVELAPRGFRNRFDAIHASPPCQAYAELATTRKRSDHPDLLDPTRQLLKAAGLPYVIENIPTAPMPNAILLCGTTFGLPIVRHRLFEINPPIGLVPSLCHQTRFARSVDHPGTYPYASGSWEAGWREHVLPFVWPWMTLDEAGQAVPPAYTEHIGHYLLTEIEARAYDASRSTERRTDAPKAR